MFLGDPLEATTTRAMSSPVYNDHAPGMPPSAPSRGHSPPSHATNHRALQCARRLFALPESTGPDTNYSGMQPHESGAAAAGCSSQKRPNDHDESVVHAKSPFANTTSASTLPSNHSHEFGCPNSNTSSKRPRLLLSDSEVSDNGTSLTCSCPGSPTRSMTQEPAQTSRELAHEDFQSSAVDARFAKELQYIASSRASLASMSETLTSRINTLARLDDTIQPVPENDLESLLAWHPPLRSFGAQPLPTPPADGKDSVVDNFRRIMRLPSVVHRPMTFLSQNFGLSSFNTVHSQAAQERANIEMEAFHEIQSTSSAQTSSEPPSLVIATTNGTVRVRRSASLARVLLRELWDLQGERYHILWQLRADIDYIEVQTNRFNSQETLLRDAMARSKTRSEPF